MEASSSTRRQISSHQPVASDHELPRPINRAERAGQLHHAPLDPSGLCSRALSNEPSSPSITKFRCPFESKSPLNQRHRILLTADPNAFQRC